MGLPDKTGCIKNQKHHSGVPRAFSIVVAVPIGHRKTNETEQILTHQREAKGKEWKKHTYTTHSIMVRLVPSRITFPSFGTAIQFPPIASLPVLSTPKTIQWSTFNLPGQRHTPSPIPSPCPTTLSGEEKPYRNLLIYEPSMSISFWKWLFLGVPFPSEVKVMSSTWGFAGG